MTTSRYDAARLDEMPDLPLGFAPDLAWKPVRRHLGLSAFGVNAYVAGVPGSLLIEDHDETGGGAGHHEELYVIIAGSARFTLDDEELDAPAGTFVAIHDPAIRRSAVALEAGTTALAIGGEPGKPFRVSPWEFSFRADAAKGQGRVDEAVGIMRSGLEEHRDNPAVLYNLACYETLGGRYDDALAHLKRAVALDPKLLVLAQTDLDLAILRDRPGFPAEA